MAYGSLSLAANEPVSFEANIDKEDLRAGENFRVVITANIKEGWTIYSLYPYIKQSLLKETTILDEELSTKFIPLTPWYESKLITKELPVLGLTLKVHSLTARFYRNFKIRKEFPPQLLASEVKIGYQACNSRICLPPRYSDVALAIPIMEGEPRAGNLIIDKHIDELNQGESFFFSDVSILGFLLLAASTGLLALLTPCVLPMIPLTVNHFVLQAPKQRSTRIYLIISFLAGITLIYSVSGILISVLWGASTVTNLAANPLVNLLSGGLFLIFAFSLYGFFKISTPSQLLNKFSHYNQRTKKNILVSSLLIGVAFTLSSFTCNLQLMGALLVVATQGNWLWPLIGMVVYSLAFGSPFILLGIFPQIFSGKFLRGGKWQHHLQVLIATLELLVAIKFFSNFDLTLQLNILTRDVVLAIYVIICLSAFIYTSYHLLFKKEGGKYAQSMLLVLAGSYLLGSIFLSTGFKNNSLYSLLDSFLPPPKEGEYLVGRGYATIEESRQENWFSNYQEALGQAKKLNKPIFVDFTGYTCINCRWMEQNIFRQREVHKELNNNFITVRLYTDGGKYQKDNQTMQISRFKTVALPFYAIISPQDKVITTRAGIFSEGKDFTAFLISGKVDNDQ